MQVVDTGQRPDSQDKVAKNLKQTQQRKAGGKGGAAAAAAEQQNSAQPGAAPRRWQDYTVRRMLTTVTLTCMFHFSA